MVNRATTAAIAAALTIGAVVVLGVRLVAAAGPADAEVIESTLILIVARQLTAGPGGLYGPFGASNPLVLIHAPLYYRLAASLAWPLTKAGLDPVTAALVAGRSLSVASLVVTLAMTARLARLDGTSRRAGTWAALLLAGIPARDIIPVVVRPDMLGIALQTAGVVLVLEAAGPGVERRAATRRTLAAFALFAAAICTKQHLVAAPAVSAAILLAIRSRQAAVAGGLLLAAVLTLTYLGAEEIVSGGRMATTLALAGGSVSRVRPSDWGRVEILFGGLAFLSIGPILLALCCLFASARPGRGRVLAALMAAFVTAAVLGIRALRRLGPGPWAGHAVALLGVMALIGVALAAVPADRRRAFGGRLDAILWAYLLGELAMMAVLCRLSSGSWLNYAAPAVVFASALLARALDRVADHVSGWRRLVLLAGALALPIACIRQVVEELQAAREDREALRVVLEHIDAPREDRYFVGDPGSNRLDGRPDLVTDDWLYPVFEAVGQAEPRAVWLRRALAEGPVRVIVTKGDGDPRVPGLDRPITALGYRRELQVGRRRSIWRRRGPPSPPPRPPLPGRGAGA